MSSEEGEGPPKRPKTGAASAFIAEPDQLLPAAEDGDAHLVAAALRNPLTDPNMTDQIGMTALMRATVHGRASVVMLLLANERVDPNIADSQGRTALIWAAGLDEDSPGWNGVADLLNIDEFQAYIPHQMAILRVLLANDRVAHIRPGGNGGEGGESYDAALAWLNRQGTDAEAAPEELVLAAVDGDDATVASALRNPLTDPNMVHREGGTALTAAVCKMRDSVVKVLIADARVDRNFIDVNGMTPLMYAAGHEVGDENATTPFFNPIDGGKTSTAKLLLADKHVDPNISTEEGETALLLAVSNGNVPMVEVLLADGRTTRTRPAPNWPPIGSPPVRARATYDAALRAVKRRRNARFKGLTRLMVAFRRMRLRAAQTVYAPGGTGFAAAAASFNAAAASAAAGGNGNGNGSS